MHYILARRACLSFLVFLGALASLSAENANVSSPDAISFPEVPGRGFDTLKEMEDFAVSSLHGGGSVSRLSISGVDVWVMKRSASWGASSAEFTFFESRFGRYFPFLQMPMTLGEFRIGQSGLAVEVSRSDLATRTFRTVMIVYEIPRGPQERELPARRTEAAP